VNSGFSSLLAACVYALTLAASRADPAPAAPTPSSPPASPPFSALTNIELNSQTDHSGVTAFSSRIRVCPIRFMNDPTPPQPLLRLQSPRGNQPRRKQRPSRKKRIRNPMAFTGITRNRCGLNSASQGDGTANEKIIFISRSRRDKRLGQARRHLFHQPSDPSSITTLRTGATDPTKVMRPCAMIIP